MSFIRFDVLAFVWMLVAYLCEYPKIMPRRAACVVLAILLGLMLFVLLLSARVIDIK